MAGQRTARTRNLILALALAALAGPSPVFGSGTAKARASKLSAFAAPAGPMVLTREVRRALADGHEFIVRKRYAIRFVPADEGYRVEGTLVDNAVEGPPAIMKLAELERTREGSPLPIKLDREGRIVSQHNAEEPAQAERTLAFARSALAGAGLPDGDVRAGLAAVSAIQARARTAGSDWPADLFRPTAGSHTEDRVLETELGNGRVRISTSAETASDGLLLRLDRTIITELGGTSRVNTENWTLTAAP